MTPVADLVGANRIISAKGIANPLGDNSLEPADEKKIRRELIELALESLQEELTQKKIYAIAVG